jgi:F-type H+-transporting ATPase subunit b
MDIDFTLLLQLGLFLIVLTLLNHILFQPLLRVFEARYQKMYGLRSEVEQLKHEAALDLEVYQSRMRAARDAAQRERDQLVATGREEERRLLAEMRAEIAKALNEAREQVAAAELEAKRSLDSQTTDLARRLVQKVLGHEVRP